jgi:hypothetical protein
MWTWTWAVLSRAIPSHALTAAKMFAALALWSRHNDIACNAPRVDEIRDDGGRVQLYMLGT